MQVSYGVVLVTIFLSNTNGLPINEQYHCNYDYSTMLSGNHILFWDILGTINKSQMCTYFMRTYSSTSVTTESPMDSTPSTISTTAFGPTSSDVQPTKSPKLTHSRKKVCKTTFRAIPILSLSNIMTFRQLYKPMKKCHWIESEPEESTIHTTATPSLTSLPPITRSIDFYLFRQS